MYFSNPVFVRLMSVCVMAGLALITMALFALWAPCVLFMLAVTSPFWILFLGVFACTTVLCVVGILSAYFWLTVIRVASGWFLDECFGFTKFCFPCYTARAVLLVRRVRRATVNAAQEAWAHIFDLVRKTSFVVACYKIAACDVVHRPIYVTRVITLGLVQHIHETSAAACAAADMMVLRTVARVVGLAKRAYWGAFYFVELLYDSVVAYYAGDGWLSVVKSTHAWSYVASVFTVQINDGARCEFVHNFRELRVAPPNNHSHPDAAASRNAAFYSITAFVKSCGFQPFFTSGSNRERSPGQHGWYMSKDCAFKPAYNYPGEGDIIVSVDDDYYRDVSRLAYFERPMVVYTFAPTAPAGVVENGHYYTDPDGLIVVRMNGGEVYRHKLWDYSSSSITFNYPLRLRTVVYSLERRDLGDMRTLLLFTPIARAYWPAMYMVPHAPLRRRDFIRGDYAVMESTNAAGLCTVSVSRLGCKGVATMAANVWEDVLERARIDGKTNVWSIVTHLKAGGLSQAEATTAASIVRGACTEFDSTARNDFNASNGSVGEAPPNYVVTQGDPRECDAAPLKSIGTVIGPAITNTPATVPARHINNDVAAICGRVEKIKNTVWPHTRYIQYAQEFAAYVVPTPGSIHPWDPDQVLEAQRTASQRGRAALNVSWVDSGTAMEVAAFMKAETTAGYGDPRNISTTPWKHMAEYSRYTYALKTFLGREYTWYGPGRTCPELADTLVRIATENGFITEADGSRFDGRCSLFLEKHVHRAIFLRAFPQCFHKQLVDLLDHELNPRAKTASNVRYAVGHSRLSGSPCTTVANSLITAFIDYAALRSSGFDHDEAIQRLGVYAGDDIVSRCLARILEETSRDVGMLHECIEHVGSTSVGFLGRKFPALFDGNPASFQDCWRTLNKAHISFAPRSRPLEEKMVDRAMGFMTSDPANPLTMAYAGMLMRVARSFAPNVRVSDLCDLPYAIRSRMDEEGDAFRGWPQFAGHQQSITALAAVMDVSVPMIEDAIRKYDAVDTMEKLRQVRPCFQCPSVSPKNNAYVEGDSFTPAPILPTPAPPDPAVLIRPRPPALPPRPVRVVTAGSSAHNKDSDATAATPPKTGARKKRSTATGMTHTLPPAVIRRAYVKKGAAPHKTKA